MFVRFEKEGRRGDRRRRGMATVEFAVVAPLIATLMMGMIAASQVYKTSIVMRNAARQGARLAGMPRDGILGEGQILGDGQSTNDKIIQDVKGFLTAAGYNGDGATVTIADALSGGDIDLDDRDNEFELFKLTVEMPMYEWIEPDCPDDQGRVMVRHYVFRNARAPAQGG